MGHLPERHLQLIYDDVLVRSVVEYRQALTVLERANPASERDDYVGTMREELDLLETELRKRGIDPLDIQPRLRPD